MLTNKKDTHASNAPVKNKQAGENENENLNVGEDNLISKDEEDYEDGKINDDEAQDVEFDKSK